MTITPEFIGILAVFSGVVASHVRMEMRLKALNGTPGRGGPIPDRCLEHKHRLDSTEQRMDRHSDQIKSQKELLEKIKENVLYLVRVRDDDEATPPHGLGCEET